MSMVTDRVTVGLGKRDLSGQYIEMAVYS